MPAKLSPVQVSTCDESKQKRTVNYHWKSETAACSDSNVSLPAEVSMDCEYLPLAKPATVGLGVLDAVCATVKVFALMLLFARGGGRPKQLLLCLFLLLGCEPADTVAPLSPLPISIDVKKTSN